MSSTTGPRYETGGIIATNALLEIQTVGFYPRKIKIHNITNNYMVEYFDALPVGTNIQHTDAGVRSVITSAVEPESGANPGIKIPAGLANINDTTTEELRWEAWG